MIPPGAMELRRGSLAIAILLCSIALPLSQCRTGARALSQFQLVTKQGPGGQQPAVQLRWHDPASAQQSLGQSGQAAQPTHFVFR